MCPWKAQGGDRSKPGVGKVGNCQDKENEGRAGGRTCRIILFFRKFSIDCVDLAKGKAGGKVQKGNKRIGQP